MGLRGPAVERSTRRLTARLSNLNSFVPNTLTNGKWIMCQNPISIKKKKKRERRNPTSN